jgi:predicted amidophosphoribosyltransferase
VPPDPWRLVLRGGHAPALLAVALGKRWALPARPLLAAVGARPRQRGLDAGARRANVRGAFTAAAAAGRVVVVDDVYTTGATLSACARALRQAGAGEVVAVTLARAVRP